jgi:hypothetical protein
MVFQSLAETAADDRPAGNPAREEGDTAARRRLDRWRDDGPRQLDEEAGEARRNDQPASRERDQDIPVLLHHVVTVQRDHCPMWMP